MSTPRISASWETIGKLKAIAAERECVRDSDGVTPCIGEMLYQIAEGELMIISKEEYELYGKLFEKYTGYPSK